MLVGVDEGVGLDDEPLDGLAALTRHRVRPEQPGVLDKLRATQALQHRVDLADVDRPAEGPAIAVRPAADRMEVLVERLQRLPLQPRGVRARPRAQLGDDRHPTVDRRLDQHPRPNHARILQPPGDALQCLLAGHELLEAEPAVAAARRRDHQDANAAGIRAIARGDAADAGHFRRRLARAVFVIFHRDGAIARSQHDRAAHLGALDIFAVDPTFRGPAILHLGHVGDRGLEHRDRVARDVAFPPAANQVGTKPEPRPLGWHGAIVPERAVRLAHAGRELDLTADRIQHEVPVISLAVDEVLGLLPLLPAVDAADFEDVRGTSWDYRVVLERQALAGDSFGSP